MALFKISKGTAAELLTGNNSQYAREGSAWFTTDDGKFYIDISGDGSTTSAVIGTNRIPLNANMADSLSHSLMIDNKSYDGSSTVTVGNTIYYVEGNTTGTAGQWIGSIGNIGALYPGLTIAYKIGIAGASTTTLNINGYGAKTVYRNNGKFTTHVPVHSVIILVYDGNYWRWADYSSDAYTIRQYPSTDDVEYPLLSRYNNTAPSGSNTYITSSAYARYDTNVTLNPSTGTITALKFNGPASNVENSLTIQLNSGTTQTGTNPDMFVYNGSATKTINITPASIGALSASDAAAGASKWTTARDFIITDADGTNNGIASSVDGSTNITLYLPSTIKATLTGNASSSDKVNSSLTIQLNGGTVETGSSPNKFVFDGSATKTINITPSSIGALGSGDGAISAEKWTTARDFKISSSDGSNESAAVSVDGSGNVVLKLASTIKADLDGNATSADQVNHTLTIQLNGGTDLQHKVEFDGSGTKSIDVTPTLIGAVDKTGDTMTGFLTLSADPTNAMHAATKQYVESYASVVTIRRWS